MARFVGLKSKKTGKTLFFNPDTVVSVSQIDGCDEESGAWVQTLDGDERFVYGRPLDVATAIGQGEPLVMDRAEPQPEVNN